MSRIARRVAEIWAELDYAQRRMLELRTGQVLTPETARRVARAEIADLDLLYAHPSAQQCGHSPVAVRPVSWDADAASAPVDASYEDRRNDRSRLP